MEKLKSIYIIKNKINDKVYIGQAIDPHHRFISHLSRAKNNEDNSPIHDAITALGKENFYYEILEKDIPNYNEREKYWIAYYHSYIYDKEYGNTKGYNLTEGGEEPPTFYGENHPLSVISNEDVLKIIEDLKQNNLTQREIAKKYNQHFQLITAINNGITHKQNNIEYPIRKWTPYHLNIDQVEEIQWLLQNGQSKISDIAEYYQVSAGTIKHINAGRNYKNPSLSYPLKIGRVDGESEPVSTILAKRSTITIDT